MAREANYDADKLVVPGHGTVLVSVTDKADPFDIESFVLGDDTSYPKDQWMPFALTSKENTFAFTKDGGDETVLDVWEFDSMDSSTESATNGFTVNAASMQKSVWDLAYGGGKYDEELKGYAEHETVPVEKSVMVIFAHGGKRAGAYMRKVKITAGDAPDISPDNFFETQLKGTILTPDVMTWGKRFWFDARPYKAAVGG
ncbi:hypothetical protein QM007_05350 [Rothia sp. SD9660Na]|uniref:phage tail tube protein n=1 Tax=Rothia sp. SD9660Na TaxID=3047030 RepID=UPI0024BB8226|nr:hypothetical protein [Rothia sp. SD9660Na]WHS51386.1 hypothetical protein QM007_05350 [Rothia sp. SD9660Na]